MESCTLLTFQFDIHIIFLQVLCVFIEICNKQFYSLRVFNFVGEPEFIRSPPTKVYLSEYAAMNFSVQVHGTPQPTIQATWSHLPVPDKYSITQIRPGVYCGTYFLSSLGPSYCGRILNTQAKNKLGKSAYKETNVTIKCKQFITETVILWI